MQKIRRRKFTCERDGLTIRGTEFKPEGEKLPIAIVSHGFMANQKSVTKYAQQLAQLGYAAYCFDFCGGCIRGKSDGKTVDMTVFTEKEDLKAVIGYAKGRTYTDGTRLVLMGCSQGGFVSALTAAELDDAVERLILFYPALCIPDDSRRGQMLMAKFDPQNIPEVIHCGPMRLGRNYPASVLELDPFEAIRPYRGPVLIVHGTDDRIVPIDYARRAKQAYNADGNEHCQLAVLKDAGHGFFLKKDAAAIARMKRFLQEKECGVSVSDS